MLQDKLIHAGEADMLTNTVITQRNKGITVHKISYISCLVSSSLCISMTKPLLNFLIHDKDMGHAK